MGPGWDHFSSSIYVCFLHLHFHETFHKFLNKVFKMKSHLLLFHSYFYVMDDDTWKVFLLKFVYSEKATEFCEISTLLLSTVHTDKSKVEILQNFVAFSEYMNFILPFLNNCWPFLSNLKWVIFEKCCGFLWIYELYLCIHF